MWKLNEANPVVRSMGIVDSRSNSPYETKWKGRLEEGRKKRRRRRTAEDGHSQARVDTVIMLKGVSASHGSRTPRSNG